MAGAVPGYKGYVESWGSPHDTILALMAPMKFSVNVPAVALDSTAFLSGGQVVRSNIKGLREVTGTMEGYNAAPVAGHLGTFTGTNMYVTNPRSWEVNVSIAELESTPFQPTGNWKTFIPGLVSWDVAWECMVDNATALSYPDATAGTAVTFTGTMSSGNTLAGTVVVTGADTGAEVGGLTLVRYTAVGTGHLTSVGSANIIAANSGAMTIPTASTLLLKTYDDSSDRTLTGLAFYTRLGIRVAVGEENKVSLSFRGTGAWTAA